ncbi:hypothetical protein HanIR_Chr04g0170861 [Helianthus annuus]|nr:hypothetical protein HanIR_Chr04g0170861 [Helianthus annuus]
MEVGFLVHMTDPYKSELVVNCFLYAVCVGHGDFVLSGGWSSLDGR